MTQSAHTGPSPGLWLTDQLYQEYHAFPGIILLNGAGGGTGGGGVWMRDCLIGVCEPPTLEQSMFAFFPDDAGAQSCIPEIKSLHDQQRLSLLTHVCGINGKGCEVV